MRVCVISPGVVHAVPRTLAIVPHFREVHYIDAANRNDTAPLVAKGVQCHSPLPGRHLLGGREIQRLLESIKPDAVVCHYSAGDHYFAATAYAKCPVAVIAMGHDVLYERGDRSVSAIERMVTRAALRQASFVSAKSKFLADRVRSFGVQCPIVVNFWGADLGRFSPGSRAESRRVLGIEPGATIILSPRAIEPRLNIDLIVQAFHDVRRRHADSRLLIIGRSNSDYQKRIEALIERLRLRDHVEIRGDISQDLLPHYYRAADLVVSLAKSEGFPNSVLEAMACKIPVVIGRIPQVGELLQHHLNAWICDIDASSVTAAIHDALSDPENRTRIVEAAYRTVAENANIQKNGQSFSENLLRCIETQASAVNPSVSFQLIFFFYRMYRKFLRR